MDSKKFFQIFRERGEKAAATYREVAQGHVPVPLVIAEAKKCTSVKVAKALGRAANVKVAHRTAWKIINQEQFTSNVKRVAAAIGHPAMATKVVHNRKKNNCAITAKRRPAKQRRRGNVATPQRRYFKKNFALAEALQEAVAHAEG